ncbi:MAG: DUF58 domain-containing protein [Oligoflexia bacterium]|nr:DUF58 domain-containing protein [Oligoflexia bacterium]
MLPKEILKKVKLLEISTRKMVNNLFAGEYHTVFKGQGLTFSDFREYVPGDDVRSISWNLTAKAGKPFIKRYDEERELTMMLMVDISGSGDFGSGAYLKGEVLVQLAAVLSFAAAKNNDRVGLMLFSDQVEHFVMPRKGRGHVHRILRDLLYYKPKGRGTSIKTALDALNGVLRKRATVFILSDFLSDDFDRSLRMMSRRHDLVAIVVEDAAEKSLPNIGLIDMQDAETGEISTVDSSSKLFRAEYESHYKKLNEARDRQLKKAQVDQIRVDTSHSFVDPLIKFFSSRHKK